MCYNNFVKNNQDFVNFTVLGVFLLKTDIEIAQSAKLKPITQIAESLGIDNSEIEQYGHFKAKISNSLFERIEKNKDGKLVLVTAVNPTPAGEGKTTVSIGLSEAMNLIGKQRLR